MENWVQKIEELIKQPSGETTAPLMEFYQQQLALEQEQRQRQQYALLDKLQGKDPLTNEEKISLHLLRSVLGLEPTDQMRGTESEAGMHNFVVVRCIIFFLVEYLTIVHLLCRTYPFFVLSL